MSINKVIVLCAGVIVTLLLLMVGFYLATPILLNWQVKKLIHEQGCESFTGDFQRPEWSQLYATKLELINCPSGMDHISLTDITIGYQPKELLKSQRLGNIHIEHAEFTYQQLPENIDDTGSFVAPLPSQLFASLPLAGLIIKDMQIRVHTPFAQLGIQGSLFLTPKQLETKVTFNIIPTSTTLLQPTTLSANISLDHNDEFQLQLKDLEAQLYEVNGKLHLNKNNLVIAAQDSLKLNPALAWLNRTLVHSETKDWKIDGEAANLWHIQLPMDLLLGKNTSEDFSPVILQQTQLTLGSISNVDERFKKLSGTLNISTNWYSDELKWQLNEGSDVKVQINDGVMPDNNLSAAWHIYSDNLTGQFQWKQPWRLLSTEGKLHLKSTDSNKLDINSSFSNILVSENSHSSRFTAIVRSKSMQNKGIKITNLQGNFTGLAATHGNEISLKLQTGSYLQGDQLDFNTLSLRAPKAAIIKPINLRAAFQKKLWQLSPMEISVATGHAAVFDIKANALNGQLSLKSNNYNGEDNKLSKSISGMASAKAYKLSNNGNPLGSLQLRAPFTLNYPSLNLDAIVTWPLENNPISLSSQLMYRLDTRTAKGAFALPQTPLSKVVVMPLFAPMAKEHNINITEGKLTASGQFALIAKGKKANWTVDLTAKTDKTSIRWNDWFVSDMSTDIQAQATQDGIGQTKLRLNAPNIKGVTELSDLDLVATYDPASQNIHFDTASVKVLGGKLSTQPFNANIAKATADFKVEVEHVELAELLKLQTDQDIHATGVVFGQIPVSINAGKPSVSFGFITASDEGGRLAYTPPNALQLSSNPGMKIALQAMDNFIYNHLSAKVKYQPDGTLWLDTAIKGHNPHWQNGQPIDFNIRIEQNLLKLLQALQFSDNLSKGLDDKIRQRIK